MHTYPAKRSKLTGERLSSDTTDPGGPVTPLVILGMTVSLEGEGQLPMATALALRERDHCLQREAR